MAIKTLNDILQLFFTICKNTKYKISCVIWLESIKDIDFIIDKIKNSITLESTYITYTNNNLPSRIEFKNNSFIDIIFIKEHKGQRYDLSAYEKNIDYNLVESIIIPCSFGGFYPKGFSLKEE